MPQTTPRCTSDVRRWICCVVFVLVPAIVCTQSLVAQVVGELQRESKREQHGRYELKKERGQSEKQSDLALRSERVSEALTSLRRRLAIERKILGSEHPTVLSSLQQIAGLYERQNALVAAIKVREEILNVKTRLLGEKHWEVIDARLAVAKAQTLSDLSHNEREKLLAAERNMRQAGHLNRQGKYQQAATLVRDTSETYKRLLGEEHPDYAASLNRSAMLYFSLGEYSRAEPLLSEAVAIRKRILGEQHPDYATSLGNLAWFYHHMCDQVRAESLFRQGIEIKRKTLGEQHPRYASSLNNLGLLYHAWGDFARAEPLLRQSTDIRKQTLGEQHPRYASSLDNLAFLYDAWGDYYRAELLMHQSINVRRKALGEQHSDYAKSLSNLAGLHCFRGDYSSAEPLLRESIDLRKKTFGEQHPRYAQSLTNLALLYANMGDYSRAEPLFQQAMKINQKTFGEQHSRYAQSLTDLAALYHFTRDYSRAEPLLLQSIDIRKHTLGEQHPKYATSLQNLASLYRAMGDYSRAEPLLLQSIGIRKPIFGVRHPVYAKSLMSLATLYFDTGHNERAKPLLRQGLEITRRNLDLTFAVCSERQQLAMTQAMRDVLDRYLSLTTGVSSEAETGYRYVLAWKGADFERQQLARLAADHANLAHLVADLRSISSRLATLELEMPNPKQRDAWRQRRDELANKKQRFESELSRHSDVFHTSRKEVTPADMRDALPEEVALVDFLRYTRRLRRAKDKQGDPRRKPHLMAFVVRGDRAVQQVDLGPFEPIVKKIAAWRNAIATGTESDAIGQELKEIIWQPLVGQLDGVRTVLLSPDGAIAYLPFAALPGRKPQTYLVEELTITTLPVPRMLPALLEDSHDRRQTEPSLLVVGQVDFDASRGALKLAPSINAQSIQRSAPRGPSGYWFGPLKSTEQEVEAVKQLWHTCHVQDPMDELAYGEATEEAFRRAVRDRQFLHLVTHGFFNPHGLRSALDPVPDRLLSVKASSTNRGHVGADRVTGYHPGVLSGLALAGANRGSMSTTGDSGELTDDGIMTAIEIAALNLRSTELAVLSAGETALGDIRSGEGILGLQRAFQVAGARTVVASLWNVDESATWDLMTRFYENLWQKGMRKAEALRQAQLAILYGQNSSSLARDRSSQQSVRASSTTDNRTRTSPRLWAAWVLSGDPEILSSSNHPTSALRP